MEMHPSPNDWSQLLGQWQAIGQQWTRWWSHADVSARPAAPPLEFGNAALGVLVPTAAWIDPAAAAETAERYKKRFAALLQRAMQGHASATGADREDTVPDRRFGARNGVSMATSAS